VTLVIESPAVTGDDDVLGPVVARVCAEFGAHRAEVTARAAVYLAGFREARVRAYVPLLVEKKLRETYRRQASDAVSG
jgi:hypothetical protein